MKKEKPDRFLEDLENLALLIPVTKRSLSGKPTREAIDQAFALLDNVSDALSRDFSGLLESNGVYNEDENFKAGTD